MAVKQELESRIWEQFEQRILNNAHPDLLVARCSPNIENVEKALWIVFCLGCQEMYGDELRKGA